MKPRGAHHSRVGGLRPRRTAFDLSYEKKFDCQFGELVPVMCDEVVPGDHFTIGCEQVVRFHPMVVPILHEVSVSTHYFFVPYRLLWNDWENFISGGPDGKFNRPLPRWKVPTSGAGPNAPPYLMLWDYMGFPCQHVTITQNPNVFTPISFPKRAYNFVWNEFYRDENFQAKIGHTSPDDDSPFDPETLDANEYLLLRNWKKDYFTSALPWQQRGEPVAFPINGVAPVMFQDFKEDPTGNNPYGYVWNGLTPPSYPSPGAGDSSSRLRAIQNASFPGNAAGETLYAAGTEYEGSEPQSLYRVGPAYADLSRAGSFDVKDLRLAVQLQKWLERNARGGVRYVELLKTHFGVSPSDARLQRPEYIGGSKSPLIVSEVLQTSGTAGSYPVGPDSPQGTMAGHALMASGNFVGKYFVKEYGLILGLLSVTINASYEDGIDRQWLRYLNTDFYWPEFVNLSEQGIYQGEIYFTGNPGSTVMETDDAEVWGYQPQYDEMRIKRNMVCGSFRVNSPNSLSYWHMGRAFNGMPSLSSNFIQMNPSSNEFQRPFAVSGVRQILVSHANRIKAVRPLPYIGEPGLVDHH